MRNPTTSTKIDAVESEPSSLDDKMDTEADPQGSDHQDVTFSVRVNEAVQTLDGLLRFFKMKRRRSPANGNCGFESITMMSNGVFKDQSDARRRCVEYARLHWEEDDLKPFRVEDETFDQYKERVGCCNEEGVGNKHWALGLDLRIMSSILKVRILCYSTRVSPKTGELEGWTFVFNEEMAPSDGQAEIVTLFSDNHYDATEPDTEENITAAPRVRCIQRLNSSGMSFEVLDIPDESFEPLAKPGADGWYAVELLDDSGKSIVGSDGMGVRLDSTGKPTLNSVQWWPNLMTVPFQLVTVPAPIVAPLRELRPIPRAIEFFKHALPDQYRVLTEIFPFFETLGAGLWTTGGIGTGAAGEEEYLTEESYSTDDEPGEDGTCPCPGTWTKRRRVHKYRSVKRLRPNDGDGDKLSKSAFAHLKGTFNVICGLIQSGKTRVQIALAIIFSLAGMTSVMVVRNSNDEREQLCDRLEQFVENELKPAVGRFLPNLEIIIATKQNGKIDPVNMGSSKPKIIVTIAEQSNLGVVDTVIQQHPLDYVLFIDEVDCHNGDTVKPLVTSIRKGAWCTFGSSGTVSDTLIGEEITPEHFFMLERPVGYCDFQNSVKHYLEDKKVNGQMKSSRFGTNKTDHMIDIDPNLEPVCRDFSTRRLDEVNNYDIHTGEWHPNDMLIRVNSTMEANRRLLADLAILFPWVVIMCYFGNGLVDLFLPFVMSGKMILRGGAIGKPLTLPTTKNGVTRETRIIRFEKSASPGKVKEWLYNDCGNERHTSTDSLKYKCIFTIAGAMASRAISYGASNKDCLPTDRLWWHLTAMYVTMAESTDQPELLQINGRSNVVKNDSIPIHIYAQKKVHEDICKSHTLLIESIHQAKKKILSSRDGEQVDNDNQFFNECIRKWPVYYRKIPKNRSFCKVDRKFHMNAVKNISDEGEDAFPIEKYGLEPDEPVLPLGHPQTRLTTDHDGIEAFMKSYCTGRTKNCNKVIAAFVGTLSHPLPNLPLSTADLSKATGIRKLHITSYSEWRINTRQKYYKLLEKVDDKWRLRQVIGEAIGLLKPVQVVQ